MFSKKKLKDIYLFPGIYIFDQILRWFVLIVPSLLFIIFMVFLYLDAKNGMVIFAGTIGLFYIFGFCFFIFIRSK